MGSSSLESTLSGGFSIWPSCSERTHAVQMARPFPSGLRFGASTSREAGGRNEFAVLGVTPRTSSSLAHSAVYRTPDGKGRSKGGFTTKEAAEDYATEMEYNQRRGQTWDAKAGAASFASAAEEWLASRHDLKPRTPADCENLLRPRTRGPIATRGLSIDATSGLPTEHDHPAADQ